MNTILCNLLITCVVGLQDISPLEELSYGTVLYEYYQGQYEGAMVRALVAETQNRTGDDPVRFRVAKGSFAFANGMFNYAHDIFSGIDAEQLDNLEQQRLAFHLAREYFRRQDWDKLAVQLGVIQLDRNWLGRQLMHPEVQFMRAELAIQSGELDKAQDILNTIPVDNTLQVYGLFNLGVAFYQGSTLEPEGEITSASDFDAAYDVFSTLSHLPVYSAETQDIVQRSRVALARLKTQADAARPQNALTRAGVSLSEQLLDTLPGSGRYQNLALASYASTAMQDQDAEVASRVWQKLKNQNNWTASSAKAYLGLPMSLELLSKEGTVTHEAVLHAYRDAEKTFQSRLDTLKSIRIQAEDSKWMGEFLATFASPHVDEARHSAAILEWQEEIGYSDWLEWLSSETVHGLLSDWSELKKMDAYLETIPENLEALNLAAIEIKRRTRAARLVLQEQGLVDKRDLLVAQIAELRSRVSVLNTRKAEYSDEWMLSIASHQQEESIRSLSRMRVVAEKELDDAQRARLVYRVERLRGLRFFDLVDTKPARLQLINKRLQVHENDMEQVDAARSRLNRAEHNYDNGIAIGLESLPKRVHGLELAISAALHNRQEMLAGEIRSGMKREIRRVERYLLIARVAIARTSDLLAAKAEHKNAAAGFESS